MLRSSFKSPLSPYERDNAWILVLVFIVLVVFVAVNGRAIHYYLTHKTYHHAIDRQLDKKANDSTR